MTDMLIRIETLEIKAAHQEQQIQDLSEMVSDQWKTIEKIYGQLSKANAKIESLENINSEGPPGLADEKPPHY